MRDHHLNAADFFELGELYYQKCDFVTAIEKFQSASQLFYDQRNFEGYLKCLNHLLRMYAERLEHEKLNQTKERLQDLILKEGFELNSKTYYSLGLCASAKGQYKTALEYLEKSLTLALAADQKEDICYSINGLAHLYFLLGRYEDALKEIYNLQVFFQVLSLPEIELSSQITNGHILRAKGKYEQALDIFWQCYELLKPQKNMYLYIRLLFAMGVTYADMKDFAMSRIYLGLVKKTMDPENLKMSWAKVEEELKRVGDIEDNRFDIIYHSVGNKVVEKDKGTVDFKNQFVLLDMLRLFINSPGETFSKEELVKRVWKQNYDPSVHDNKIYVTIKRLRKLIEPDYEKPKYIFRAKNGYYLNKETKIFFEN